MKTTKNLPVKAVGWKVLLKPMIPQEVTKGGIILSDMTKDSQLISALVCEVVDVGPQAYADKERYPEGPWCKIGDFVMIGRLAGSRFRIDDEEYRLLNEDEVQAQVSEPSRISKV